MADIDQIGKSALANSAPAPILRLLSGINPQFSLFTGKTQAMGDQPAGGKEFAGVPKGSPNQIVVTDPAKFLSSPGQSAAHEATHLIVNNLSPQQQAQIPPDVGDPTVALNPTYLAKQRAAGKSMLQLPREQQGYMTQYYVAQKERFKNGAISPQQMQQVEQTYGPWIQDYNKVQLSNIKPTDPDSNTLNTTPRAPMPPVNLQQDTVQFDTGQQGPITASMLAGMNQQPQQAPPQYVPPVVANTNKWAKLVTGALAGAGGGLSAGLQNVMDAGTPRGPHANGYAAGAAASQQLQDQQAQQQQAQQQQAQQNFENQSKQFQMGQEQQLNRARTMEANLNALKLGMAMDNAPKEQQDAYYKDQDAHSNDLRKAGMTELAEVPDLNSVSQWMKQNNKNTADVVFTHHRGEDGKDRIMVWENPDHEVDSATLNSRLRTYGYPEAPAGTTMSARDAHALVAKAQGLHADFLNKQALQKQTQDAELKRTQLTQAGEDRRAQSKQGGGSENQPDPEKVADAIAAGRGTFEQLTGGMGKEAASFRRDVEQKMLDKYPNLNIGVLKAQSKLADNAQYQGSLNTARSLFGANGDEGSLDTLERAIRAVPKASMPFLSKLRQKTEYNLGSPEMAEVKALKTDIATELAKFNTGNGAAASDHQIEQYREQLNEAQTPEQIEQVLKGIRQVSAQRLHGLVGTNVFAQAMTKDINNPVKQTAHGHKVGDIVTYQGKQMKINRILPNGQVELQ